LLKYEFFFGKNNLINNIIYYLYKDTCGTSDPYVQIQCGSSLKPKKTRTIKKTLNPVWNEQIQFEFISTANSMTGDSDSNKDDLIIRIYDEDYGIKGQIDKILTTEDFLGQVTLKINDLNISGEHVYQLKPRNNKEYVSGTISLVIGMESFEIDNNNSTSQSNADSSSCSSSSSKHETENWIEQYRILHMHAFDYLFKSKTSVSEETNSWLNDSIDLSNYKSRLTYFKDTEINLFLNYFANKYMISDIQRQMIHLECLYMFFIDIYICSIEDSVRNFENISKMFAYITYLLNKVSASYMNKTINDNNHLDFLNETKMLPDKLVLLIAGYRQFYKLKHNEKHHPVLFELKEIINLFRSVCNFIEKNLVSRSFINQLINFDNSDNSRIIQINGYCEKKQLNIINECIEFALNTEMTNLMCENMQDFYIDDEIDPHFRIDYIKNKLDLLLNVYASKRLIIEIELNAKFYYEAFNEYYFNQKQFKLVCVRIITKCLLQDLIEFIVASEEMLAYLSADEIKKILNLYLLTDSFINDNNLKDVSLCDLLSYTCRNQDSSNASITSSNYVNVQLNELFQPFLFDYIKEQESKFIIYINKLYDMNNINSKFKN